MRNLKKYVPQEENNSLNPMPPNSVQSSLNNLSQKTTLNTIQPTNKKVYLLTPLNRFLTFYEKPNEAEVTKLMANLARSNMAKLARNLLDMCKNQVNHTFGSNHISLRVYKPRGEEATLNNLKIYIQFMNNVVDVEESLASIINNVNATSYELINDPKQYSYYANEFLTLLASPQSVGNLRMVADYYQIKHLTFAKLWNYLKKYNIPFRNENKLTSESAYQETFSSRPYTVMTSAFFESDSLVDKSFSGNIAFDLLSETKNIVNTWLKQYTEQFKGYNFNILTDYIKSNSVYMLDKNIYNLMINNYNENAMQSISIGEHMLNLTFKTFFANPPSLPYRDVDDVVQLQDNVVTACIQANMQDFLEQIKSNSNQFYNTEINVKQKTIIEMMMIMGSLYSSQLFRLNTLLSAYKKFDINLSPVKKSFFSKKSVLPTPESLVDTPQSSSKDKPWLESTPKEDSWLYKEEKPVGATALPTEEKPIGATALPTETTPFTSKDIKPKTKNRLERKYPTGKKAL
nr:uncharacterized protein LOC124815002 [Hydra vulgaris]